MTPTPDGPFRLNVGACHYQADSDPPMCAQVRPELRRSVMDSAGFSGGCAPRYPPASRHRSEDMDLVGRSCPRICGRGRAGCRLVWMADEGELPAIHATMSAWRSSTHGSDLSTRIETNRYRTPETGPRSTELASPAGGLLVDRG